MNNVLNSIYSEAVVAKTEYEIMNNPENNNTTNYWDCNGTIDQILNSNSSKNDKITNLNKLKTDYKSYYDSFQIDFNRIDGVRKLINVRGGWLCGTGTGLMVSGLAAIITGGFNIVNGGAVAIAIGVILLAIGAVLDSLGIVFLHTNETIIAFTDI